MTPQPKQSDQDAARESAGVATPADNAKLEHTEGGTTTRDDRHDVGVPMLPGDPREPQGPEDALGEGPKRGDYPERVPGRPHTSVPLEGAGEPVRESFEYKDADGKTRKGETVTDYRPVSEVVPQAPRAADRGEVAGRKGGVDSAEPART